MSIALDVATTSAVATASPLTWSHTTASGSNMFLVVGIDLTDLNVTQPTVTGVTYNSVAMTKAIANQATLATQKMETSIWMLHAPNTGANTVSVSFTGGTPHIAGVSVTYSGAQTTDVADATGTANGTATGSQSFTVTTVADQCWIFAIGQNGAVSAPTLAANQTSRGTATWTGVYANIMRAEDTNAAVSAGANSVGFTVGAGVTEDGWLFSGASFAPFGASGAKKSPLTILGAG